MMDLASSDYTSFKYELAQGLANAPRTFQRLIDKIFRSKLLRGKVSVYFDDFLIHTARLEDHKSEVDLTVKALKENNLKVKLKKCEILKTKIQF